MTQDKNQNPNPGKSQYYDVDFDYPETSKSETNSTEASTNRKTNSSNNHIAVEQSIVKIKNLLKSAAEEKPIHENPYKTLTKSGKPTSPVNGHQNKSQGISQSIRDTISSKTHEHGNLHTNNDRLKMPLPSPEEIRAERERRRRQRIDELERLSTPNEVVASHKKWLDPVTTSIQETDNNETNHTNTPSLSHNKSDKQPLSSIEKVEKQGISHSEKDTLNLPAINDKSTVVIVKAESQANVRPENNLTETPSAVSIEEKEEKTLENRISTREKDHTEKIESLEDLGTEEALASGQDLHTEDSHLAMKQEDTPPLISIDSPDSVHPSSVKPDIKVSRSNIDSSRENNSVTENETLSSKVEQENSDNKLDAMDYETNPTIVLDEINSDINTGDQNGLAHDSLVKSKKHTNKRQKKSEKAAAYSLSELNLKQKIIFAFNVFFNVIKRFAIYILLIGILFAGLAGGAGIGYFAYLVGQTPPPTKQEMTEQLYRVDQQSKLYYGDGTEIASVRADVVRTVTSLEEISPYIVDGLIATEDEYFYEHPGVVPKAILRATLQELLSSGSGTGGSTLTQQLVKQQMLTNDVTFFRKANEILLALRVENYFTKDEILTAYLNISPFGRNNNGDNVAGILAASQGIFGKDPDQVNLAQAAFLVGLPQDPYTYTPYDQYGTKRQDFSAGVERMKEVLFRMYRSEKITKEEYETALQYDITKDFIDTVQIAEERQTYLYQAMMNGAVEQIMRVNIADQGLTWDQVSQDVDWYNEFYFAAEEQLRTGGYHVYTTIDKAIYDQLQTSALAYKDQLGVAYDGVYTDPETGQETYYVENVQSGLVVMDNASGKVLGFISGTDYETNQIDHAFGMRRSPGSTIKPLAVYAPAIEYNMINPSTLIPDTAFEMTYEDGSTWTPTNYGSAVSGNLMTARTALLRSDNLPAVRIYQKLLENNIKISDFLRKMGFDMVDGYTETDTQNLAFSLGGVTTGPTVFEQTRAFTTFANNGFYVGGYFIDRITDNFGNIIYQHQQEPVEVYSEDTNYLMVDMLRDTNTDGTGRTAAANMAMGGDWIAKSGISENSRDVWYIASTPAITIGTWIGYDNRYVDYYIDINDGFGRESERVQLYWSNIANDLYAIRPEIFGTDLQFQQPDSVTQTAVLSNTGTLPGQLNVNGTVLSLTQPLVNEVFKVSNPAPNLTYDFIFNGTEEDSQRFWASYIQQAQEAFRRQQESRNAASSNAETTTQSNEVTTQSNEVTTQSGETSQNP